MKNTHDETVDGPHHHDPSVRSACGSAAAGEVPCPIGGCDETPPKTRLPKHIREAHAQ